MMVASYEGKRGDSQTQTRLLQAEAEAEAEADRKASQCCRKLQQGIEPHNHTANAEYHPVYYIASHCSILHWYLIY
jgi:hypothetical protein